jgi:hypothetical protein
MRESSGNPRRRSSVVEQRFRNFLCKITPHSPEILGIGATTGGRHRVRHTELLCSLNCVRFEARRTELRWHFEDSLDLEY